MTMNVNIDGVWKTVNGVYVNVGGVWKTVNAVYSNIGGVWKTGYSVDVTSGLIHRWPLTSNANDIISTWNLTNLGTITYDINGAYFGGNHCLYKTLGSLIAAPCSITFWVKSETIPSVTSNPFNLCDPDGTTVTMLYFSGSNLYGYIFQSSNPKLLGSGTSLYTINKYNLFSLQYSSFSGSQNCWVNLNKFSTNVINDTAYGSSYQICIGRTDSRTDNYYPWIGYIKDVRIYNRILSDAEMDTLYSNGPL